MHFVIAGRINCPQFSYAVMVAQRLKENLPDFNYLKIPKKPEEWEKWLVNICKENGWYHIQSPLIWREMGLKKGKKDFVGDINKFLDLCYDYYGIPREILSAESFNRGEMDWFTNRTESEFFENVKLEANKRREYKSRQVCITGASSQVTEIVVMELLQMAIQSREDGLEIRLFDDPTKEKKLASSSNDAKHCPGPSGFGNCRVATSLKEALTNIDLVIVLDSFGRKPKESLVKWLKRNRNAMCALGKALNIYAPPHCRVIIGSPSNQPICYNATVLASFATNLHVRNIVAVTQDLGREMLKSLSTKTNVPLKDFFCPPVWGFVGLNKYIDVRKTLQTHLYKVPGKRIHSTIPQGTEEYELRTTEYFLNEKETVELHVKVANHKTTSYPQLGRWPCLSKATAILDLLRLWGLKQEDGNGEILCLGVYSDGTFNIPEGIYWSQPVILRKGFWVPYEEFPIPRSSLINCYNLFLYSLAAIYRTKIKPRRYVPPKPELKAKGKTKFDFDKIIEEIGIPVIRTDAECMSYIKYLAKKELGIDFDATDSVLEEESEPETIPTEEEAPIEKIYCECWRQELKQFQKIVFDRSSTTEMEVDLSDNISGPEWLIINPSEKTSGNSLPGSTISGFDNKSGNTEFLEKDKTSKSSSSTVCSCEPRPDGSICGCLIKTPSDTPMKRIVEEPKISTEHFYKEQNAQIFDEDLKDVIYADSYVGEKHVTFDEDTKSEDESKIPYVKFYGKKDTIRDIEADSKMKERIERYERSGKESIEEEEEEEEEAKIKQENDEKSTTTEKSTESIKDAKFHISIEGVSYDIIGNQDGLECLDEVRRGIPDADSSHSFREMYIDDIMPSLRVFPSRVNSDSETMSDNISFVPEESNITLKIDSKTSEISGEKSNEPVSTLALEEALEAVWEEGLFHEETEQEETEEDFVKPVTPVEKKRKREGIPLCCLCRCIVPEGLPCCPCGASTVVEVFKKESIEVFIQSEDDLTFRVEFFETKVSSEPSSEKSSVPSVEELSQEKEIEKKELPPESFFPFTPKIENKFMETVRPDELTKDYYDSLMKYEKNIPEKCVELLNLAKDQLQEEKNENLEEFEKKGSQSVLDEIPELSVLGEDDSEIKTDFSDLKLFIPDGIEDWRMTVQKKYREWFFQGPKIRDECYYDIAIEEVSEDEFDFDKEMEQYFEY